MKLLVILAALVLPAAAYAGTATATGPAGGCQRRPGRAALQRRAAAARRAPAPLRATHPPLVLEARPRRRPEWARARRTPALWAPPSADTRPPVRRPLCPRRTVMAPTRQLPSAPVPTARRQLGERRCCVHDRSHANRAGTLTDAIAAAVSVRRIAPLRRQRTRDGPGRRARDGAAGHRDGRLLDARAKPRIPRSAASRAAVRQFPWRGRSLPHFPSALFPTISFVLSRVHDSAPKARKAPHERHRQRADPLELVLLRSARRG